MKVLFITSGYNRIAREMIRNKEIDLVGVAFTRQKSKKMSLRLQIINIVFDIYCRIFRIIRTGKNIPAFTLYKDNQQEFIEWSKKLQTDLTVVFSSPFIFTDELINSSPLGVINIHPSLLPKYRGPQPLLWQYLNFDLNGGVTVHYIDKKEDTGDIILQKEFKIGIGAPLSQTLHKAEKIGSELLFEAIISISNGENRRIKQPELSSTGRAYRIDKKSIYEQIQWEEWPVERIYHLLNGIFSTAELAKYTTELASHTDLKIKGYSNHVEYPLSEVGKVVRSGKGFQLICKNGLIQIGQNAASLFLLADIIYGI